MGQVLHGSATTTAAVRRAIQYSQESLNRLAERYDINPKTVAKWKKRPSVQDERTHRPQAAALHGALDRGGHRGCVPAPHALSAGRLPLCGSSPPSRT